MRLSERVRLTAGGAAVTRQSPVIISALPTASYAPLLVPSLVQGEILDGAEGVWTSRYTPIQSGNFRPVLHMRGQVFPVNGQAIGSGWGVTIEGNIWYLEERVRPVSVPFADEAPWVSYQYDPREPEPGTTAQRVALSSGDDWMPVETYTIDDGSAEAFAVVGG